MVCSNIRSNLSMVRLDENYKAHLVRKWINHYLDYDILKECVEPNENKFQPK